MKKHFKEIREFIASRNSSKQMKLYDIQKINLKRQFKPIRSGHDHHRNFQSNNRSKSPENPQNSDQDTKRPSLKRKLVIKIKSIFDTDSSSSEKSNSTMRSTSSMTLKTIENRHNAQTSPLAYAEEARDPSLATHILDVRTEHELLSKSLSRHTQEKYGFADRVAVKQVNQILEICDDQGQKFNEHPYFCKKRLKQSESQGDPYQSRSPYLRSKEISLHCLKNWISPIKRFVPLKTKSSYSRKLRLQSNPRQLHQNQTVVQDHAQRIERNSMIKCLKNDLKKFIKAKDCEALRYKDQEDKAQDDHYNCAKGRGKT
ncbi:unnamed protein product [Moneuplotes crassus]|uniref:Uncharacterized protein n=1 Tax=Euplotes crassus TaxID=5936 RepID=A0AAD1X5Z0_EUPCR|nr:unnamed protein product [Moneuplotes crassus]